MWPVTLSCYHHSISIPLSSSWCHRIVSLIFGKNGTESEVLPDCNLLSMQLFFMNMIRVFYAPDLTIFPTDIYIKIEMCPVTKNEFFVKMMAHFILFQEPIEVAKLQSVLPHGVNWVMYKWICKSFTVIRCRGFQDSWIVENDVGDAYLHLVILFADSPWENMISCIRYQTRPHEYLD